MCCRRGDADCSKGEKLVCLCDSNLVRDSLVSHRCIGSSIVIGEEAAWPRLET